MDIITKHYQILEERILKRLEGGDIKHRTKNSTGLWLGPLVALTALLTFLQEDNSYSEICLLVGITGAGLIISSICLYIRLMLDNTPVKDYHAIYFLPAIILSTLYLLVANKGLLVCVTWGITIGSLSTWGVIQVMSHFPGCFTLGEATVVVHGISLFLLSCFTNLPLRYHLPPIHDSDIATVILQIGILYIISICLACAAVPKLRHPIPFYILFFGTLLLIVIPLLHVILDQSPIVWMIYFLFNSSSKIYLFTFWTVCLIYGSFAVLLQVVMNSKGTTSTRKIFHILAVFVYIPGLLWQPTVLYFASGVIFAFFVALELLRILKIPPIGKVLQNGFFLLVDEKDSLISLSPLYLLSGLSVTLWMPTPSLDLLPLMSGILSIGLGDSAASIFGSKWGKHKWTGSSKTIEGTCASIAVQLLLILICTSLGYFNINLLVRSLIAVIIVSLVEARTEQIDNLALPLLMYLCLMI